MEYFNNVVPVCYYSYGAQGLPKGALSQTVSSGANTAASTVNATGSTASILVQHEARCPRVSLHAR